MSEEPQVIRELRALRVFVMIFDSPLYVICDAEVCQRAGWTVVDFASACLDGGARLLQIRDKTASSQRLLADSLAIVDRATAAAAQVIVNDRADIARLAGAAGVHVGQDDLSPAAVREVVGDTAVVGRSTHTIAELHAALMEPISYIAVGPIFSTTTKATRHDALGLDPVREAAKLVQSRVLPLVAIGGITLDRAEAVIASGASAVAVISDLLVTSDPCARVRAYLQRLSRL